MYSQVQKGDDIYGEFANDFSGVSISLNASGNTIAIGAENNFEAGLDAGHVRVFRWNGTKWVQKGNDIDGENEGDQFGTSLNLSSDGNTIAVGARFNSENAENSGHVRVFKWNGTQWTQKGSNIDGENKDDQFGSSLSLSADGNIIAIGAPYNCEKDYQSGHVKIFEWDGSKWVQKGKNIVGENKLNHAAIVSLSKDGNSIAIGSPFNDDNGESSGHVRVFEWKYDSWTQKGLTMIGDAEKDFFGTALSLCKNGNRIAIGAPGNDDQDYAAGHVKVFEWNQNEWKQLGNTLKGMYKIDGFGDALAFNHNGTRLIIGVSRNDINGFNSGHVQVYSLVNSIWEKTAIDIVGDAVRDKFGGAVSIDSTGYTIAVSAKYSDGNGVDSGQTRIYTLDN